MAKQLPTLCMERLLKISGANRVSEDAKTELQKILKKEAIRISERAAVFSKHARRKTIKKEDICLATEN